MYSDLGKVTYGRRVIVGFEAAIAGCVYSSFRSSSRRRRLVQGPAWVVWERFKILEEDRRITISNAGTHRKRDLSETCEQRDTGSQNLRTSRSDIIKPSVPSAPSRGS